MYTFISPARPCTCFLLIFFTFVAAGSFPFTFVVTFILTAASFTSSTSCSLLFFANDLDLYSENQVTVIERAKSSDMVTGITEGADKKNTGKEKEKNMLLNAHAEKENAQEGE